jgi:predicted ATPase/DNA-binding CsgD family transcriptional regulator
VSLVDAGGGWLERRLAPLIGREAEVLEIDRLLGATRLLTITGTGGAGKTRLAIEVAGRTRRRISGDVVFADLSAIDDSELIGGAVRASLGIGEGTGRDPLAVVADRLRRGRALLVLDNCEHVVDGAAEVAEVLLARCARLRILATSRVALHAQGEVAWPAPPLSVPDQTSASTMRAVRESGAGRLFLEVAQRRRPELVFGPEDAEAIVRICRELDGVPLAIELAAARVAVLTPTQIADGLSRQLRLLSGGPLSSPARQRTLRASLDWSHGLLNDAERTLFRRLSVFRSGSTLATTEAVCGLPPLSGEGILDLVAGLIDKSLITMTDTGGEARYGMHESVRQYAVERLDAGGDGDRVRAASIRHFAALARAANGLLEDAEGRAQLAAEDANLRVALSEACDRDADAALEMAAGLARAWLVRDRYREGLAACSRVLAVAPDGDPAHLAVVHWAAGNLANFTQQYESAFTHAAVALQLAEAAADPSALGLSLQLMSGMVNAVDPAEGARSASRAVEVLRDVDDDFALGLALANLTLIEGMRDRFDDARRAYEQFVAVPSASRHPWLRGLAEVSMAWAEVGHGDPRAALAHAERAQTFTGTDESMIGLIARAFEVRARAVLGEASEARRVGEALLDRARRANLGVAIPTVEVALLVAELALGDLQAARGRAERLSDEPALHTVAVVHDAFARIALADGDAEAARGHALSLAETAARTGSPRQRALSELALGAAALTRDIDEARERVHAALALQLDADLIGDVPDSLETLAALTLELGDAPVAARLLGAAVAARRELGCVALPPAEARIAALSGRGQEVLGRDEWSDAYRRGEELSLTQALAYARRARGGRNRTSAGWGSLTPTEQQVVELVAAGLTNPRIGERLLMSRSTVKAHLSHVYAKLEMASRTELAAAAARRSAPAR